MSNTLLRILQYNVNHGKEATLIPLLSSIAKVCCRRDFRPSVRISCSHPTKPPHQQYDASVGSYFLSTRQFSYHFQPQTLSPPSCRLDITTRCATPSKPAYGQAQSRCKSPARSVFPTSGYISCGRLLTPSTLSLLLIQASKAVLERSSLRQSKTYSILLTIIPPPTRTRQQSSSSANLVYL